jgi:hypothetical protein
MHLLMSRSSNPIIRSSVSIMQVALPEPQLQTVLSREIRVPGLIPAIGQLMGCWLHVNQA